MRPKNIEIGDLVVSPLNVREDVGDIKSLAQSIKEEGLLHPLTVRQMPNNKYEIIAGRRRYESCKSIGMRKIPANIQDEMDDRRAVLVSLKENLRRGDITAAEKKRAIWKLLELDGGDNLPNRRKVAKSLNLTMAELKAAIEIGEFAETLEPHNIVVKIRQKGEPPGKTTVPLSVGRDLMKTFKEEAVKEALAEMPSEEAERKKTDIIREATGLRPKERKEFLKDVAKDPYRPVMEIKRHVTSPDFQPSLLATLPIRLETTTIEALKQYALDSNMGDRAGLAAKNLILEGLATKDYLTMKMDEEPGIPKPGKATTEAPHPPSD